MEVVNARKMIKTPNIGMKLTDGDSAGKAIS